MRGGPARILSVFSSVLPWLPSVFCWLSVLSSTCEGERLSEKSEGMTSDVTRKLARIGRRARRSLCCNQYVGGHNK